MRCELHPFGTLDELRFVVTVTFCGDRVLLSRRRDRLTWETQGGHIEPGESPRQAAERELYEESGAKDYSIRPLCDYRVLAEDGASNGAVFVAELYTVGPLPQSEMAEARLFDGLPSQLTYPDITPLLYRRALQARTDAP